MANTAVSSSMTDYSRGGLLQVTFLTKEIKVKFRRYVPLSMSKLRTWFKRADFYKIQSSYCSFSIFFFLHEA